MILTEIAYNDIWVNDFKMPKGSTPPSYHEYLQREVYKQDYLDLFGKSKSISFNRTLKGGVYYVAVLGHTIEVDYDYPFATALKKVVQREIKYILIGEAPNKPKRRSGEYGANDTNNTYFYNILHINYKGGYFTSPCEAFGISFSTKTDNLIELANRGVLLVDLFPFAITYTSSIRRNAFIINMAIDVFNNHVIAIAKNADYKFSPDLKFCFLCSIDHAIQIINRASGIGAITTTPINLLSNTASIWQDWKDLYLPVVHKANLHARVGNWHGLSQALTITNTLGAEGKRIHRFKSIGKTMSYNCIPHEIPIRFAFDLP